MKLPIFKAFGATFGVVFGNLPDIIRIVWLPSLALTAASLYFLRAFSGLVLGLFDLSDKPSPWQLWALFMPILPSCAVLFLAGLIFVPMYYAGLLRFFIRGEKPSGPFYLRFGGDELNVLLTYIALLAINIGLGLAIGIPQGVVVGLLGATTPAGSLTNGVIELAGAILNVWIGLRLCLAFPAAIAQRRLGIGPSWSTSKGNVWHLLGYFLLWGVLIVVIMCVALALIPGVSDFFRDFAEIGRDESQVKEMLRGHFERWVAWIQAAGPGVWITIVINYLVGLVVGALSLAAVAMAYRFIAEGEASEA